jgi:hypothetical protein
MQIRRGIDAHGGSDDPRARGRRALWPGASRSTTAEGDEHRHQTPHRPRHRLHNAAGRYPTRSCTCRDPGFLQPPAAGAADGGGTPGSLADEVDRPGSLTNRPLSTVDEEVDPF